MYYQYACIQNKDPQTAEENNLNKKKINIFPETNNFRREQKKFTPSHPQRTHPYNRSKNIPIAIVKPFNITIIPPPPPALPLMTTPANSYPPIIDLTEDILPNFLQPDLHLPAYPLPPAHPLDPAPDVQQPGLDAWFEMMINGHNE